MANNIPRTAMPVQDPKVRATNFDEVALGYTRELASLEASRCIECKNPRCVKGCPVNIDIPGFIKKIKEGEVMASYGVLCETIHCLQYAAEFAPRKRQCEQMCVLGIKGEPVAIGRLERYVADTAMCDCISIKKTEKKHA